MDKTKTGSWNAARVLRALGKIGYHPVAALLDITDNSVSFNATKIAISIETTKGTSNKRGRPRAVISSFSIFDNGEGMDEDGLHNALTLGSSEEYYSKGTLSKFGMGLKSAAFSLGERLELISRSSPGSPLLKAIVDRQIIVESDGSYIYRLVEPSEFDKDQFDTVCGAKSGTIVRITNIHTDSMLKPSEIIQGITYQAGIVYYYYLAELIPDRNPVEIIVYSEIDGKIENTYPIKPIDPLFVSEATEGLDEQAWDGLNVKWITQPQKVPLDPQGASHVQLEIIQLPHPPSVGFASGGDLAAQRGCREKYQIKAGNYGFYIYRNYRLISWADNLQGLVPFDKKLYGFRGRLLITSNADELLNIDVTKSRIQLSELAYDHLRPEVTEAKSMSQKAWTHRTAELRKLSAQPPHAQSNEEINKAASLAEKDDEFDEDVAPPTERQELVTRRQIATDAKPATEEEKHRLREEGQRVQYVSYLENNQLWERAHDPAHSLVVKVNQSHRFFREVPFDETTDSKLIKLLDMLFFALARGEYSVVYKYEGLTPEKCEEVLQEYRERVGADLSEMIRRVNIAALLENES